MVEYYVDDNTLRHFGVKGMKWGVRRESNGSGSGKRPTRKEWRASERKRRSDFDQLRAREVLDVATRAGSESLIMTRLGEQGHFAIMTGKEFVSHVSNGGVFDVRATDVAAVRGYPVDLRTYQTIGKRFESRKRPK